MRHPNPGMGNYQPNMYNGPNQMGPGGQPMYNNMSGPGMGRSNYNNMYSGQGGMMGMNNQYGSYGGPGQNSQSGGPGPTMGSPGPSTNGPQASANSMPSGNNGANGPLPGPPVGQGQTPIKGAQAAAQAAMAAANAAARSQPSPGRPNMASGSSQRVYNPNMSVGPHSMSPQSMSPLSHMGQMNQMGYNSTNMNNMSPHPQNSVSPVPPNMMGQNMPPSGKMHNSSSVNNYSSEQPLPKSKSKSKSISNTNLPPTNVPNNLRNSTGSPHMGMPSPSMQDSNMQPPQPVSTPASTLSDTGSQSNDSTSMGPMMNNDSSGAPQLSAPGSDRIMTGTVSETPVPKAESAMKIEPSGDMKSDSVDDSTESNTAVTNNTQYPITTQANTSSIGM